MKCHVCGKQVSDGVALYRQNEKGVKGVWACEEHNSAMIDPLVKEIVEVVENNQ